jgi:GT2 family glycosyltransferase
LSRLSIIIVNWNGEELLSDCLDPLAAAGFEVILVDNASTDGSLALLRSQYPWVRLVANDENRGFAGANNQGIARAEGDYVLLLNSDTVPDVAAIRSVVAFLEDHAHVGIAGPSLNYPDGSRQPSCGPGPNLWTELLAKTMLHRLLPGIRTRAPGTTCRVDWVTGAALFMRRSLASEIGGLDESMFMFYEDLDFCARTREAGHEVWFVFTPPILHVGGASRRKVETRSLVQSYQSTERFFRRHGPRWRRYLLRALTIPEVTVRSLVWAILAFLPRHRVMARARLQSYLMILRLTLTGRLGSSNPL